MAQGEKTWSSRGQKVVRYNFTPVPSQDWTAKILGETVEVKKKNEPGKFPYVNVALECLDSAMEEGQKNRRIYHRFFLKLTPGKDGVAAPNRNGGLVEFAHAMGEEFDFEPQTQKDEHGVAHKLLNPKQVAAWLKNMDGLTVRLHSKIKKSKDYDPQAEVDMFHAPEDGVQQGPDDDAPADEYDHSAPSEYSTEAAEEEQEAEVETAAEEPEEEYQEEAPAPIRQRTAAPAKQAPRKVAPPPPTKGKARPAARR
jgi:hypothetical protein